MRDEEKEISEGLNQLFEIINAKGDIGEIKEIVKNNKESNTNED